MQLKISSYEQFCNESTDYNHLLTPEQLEWRNRYLRMWSVNEHGMVDVNAAVSLSGQTIKQFPIRFGNGIFSCVNCTSLKTLDGISRTIGGFYCSGCHKLPEEQVELANDKVLFRKWLKSGLTVDEFLMKIRVNKVKILEYE